MQFINNIWPILGSLILLGLFMALVHIARQIFHKEKKKDDAKIYGGKLY